MSDSDGGDSGFPPAPANPPPPPRLTPPPGYASYGGSNQGAFTPFQPVGSLGRWIGICLVVLVPVQAFSVLKSFSDRGKARDFVAGRITENDYTSSVGASAVLGILSLALFVAIAVMTMPWMYRMAKNQQSMGRMGTWKPGWAIGGWFAPPFVIYMIPFLMFRDLWKASDPEPVDDWRRNSVAPVINVWWILYGLAPMLFLSVTFTSFQLDRTAIDAAKEVDSKFGVTLTSSLVQVAATVSYLLLVRQLTARHQRAINGA